MNALVCEPSLSDHNGEISQIKLSYCISEISLWLDFISRLWLTQQQFESGSVSRVASPGIDVCAYNIMYIVVNPLPCGEISRAVFIGTSWLKYVARFRENTQYLHFTAIVQPICITTSLRGNCCCVLLPRSHLALMTTLTSVHIVMIM